MLSAGADSLAPNKLGQLPLHVAAPDSPEWSLLASQYADVALLWADANGNTPLHIAARLGDPALLQELLVRSDEPVHKLLKGQPGGLDCPLKCLVDAVAEKPRVQRLRPLPSLAGLVPPALRAVPAHFDALYKRRHEGGVTLRAAGGERSAHSFVLRACSAVLNVQLRDNPDADVLFDGSLETLDAVRIHRPARSHVGGGSMRAAPCIGLLSHRAPPAAAGAPLAWASERR